MCFKTGCDKPADAPEGILCKDHFAGCTMLPGVSDCCHTSCRWRRGEATSRQVREERADWHWDTNWGRFSSEERRKKVHDALVDDGEARDVRDDYGRPTVDIMGCVWAGISEGT